MSESHWVGFMNVCFLSNFECYFENLEVILNCVLEELFKEIFQGIGSE